MPLPLYSQGKSLGTHCTGEWVSPRADVDAVKKKQLSFFLPEIEPRFLSYIPRNLVAKPFTP
jgi:hypothetical protein